MQAAECLVHDDVFDFKYQPTTFRHSVLGVGSQVQNHLLDLADVGMNQGTSVYEVEFDSDHAGNGSLQHFGDLGYGPVEVKGSEVGFRLAAESQDAPYEVFGSFRRLQYLLQFIRACPADPVFFQRQLGVPGDRHQNVVEVVSNASCQGAYGFHFLRLKELGLELAASLFGIFLFGNVGKGNNDC